MAQSSHGGSHRRHREQENPIAKVPGVAWDAKEALYRRELDEARARAAQMEKTMRWWSDCTANWRDKWAKVRNERNKAREDTRQIKMKMDALAKELAAVKSDKMDLQQQFIDIKKDNEKLLKMGERGADFLAEDGVELRMKYPAYSPADCRPARQRVSLDSHKFSNVDEALADKLGDMKLRLEETNKSLHTERDQKAFLLAKIESLTAELNNTKLELLRGDRTLGSNDSSHSEVERLQIELQDEIGAKQTLEEKMAELKMEMEKLRSENTIQWSKRELLETENVAILRENKKLYSQVCELREQIHKLNRISDGAPYDECHRIKSSISPRSLDASSDASSEANLIQCDAKITPSEHLAIIETND